MTDADPPPTIDRDDSDPVVRRLADPRRRRIVEQFRDGAPETAGLADLAARLPALDGATAEERRLRLHHVDLPALDDAGLGEYDPDRNVFHYDPDEDARAAVRSLLGAVEE